MCNKDIVKYLEPAYKNIRVEKVSKIGVGKIKVIFFAGKIYEVLQLNIEDVKKNPYTEIM